MVPNGVHNIEVPLYTTTIYNIHCTCTYTTINYPCSPFYKVEVPTLKGINARVHVHVCTSVTVFALFSLIKIFVRHWKFGMTKINHNYENCLHSCGLYTMGLVKTKFLLIDIFANEN